jgi:hypothetical protein
MLFARSKEELLQVQPRLRPEYQQPRLNPYRLIDAIGQDEADDPYHYAPSLIERVAQTPRQRIGSHTFCHYYCLEAGQSVASFEADLKAAQSIARQTGYSPSTALVFPRNQYRTDYFGALRHAGFTSYRGNPRQWFWQSRSGQDTKLYQRAVRLLDNYLPLSRNGETSSPPPTTETPYNVPADRFFRPYITKIDGYGGQRLKIRRILSEMTAAARTHRNYHLWWHPHNLATHPGKNMAALREITTHYGRLHRRYGWHSHSMESYVETAHASQ